LIASLIQDKEERLCSKRYRFKDLCSASASLNSISTTPQLSTNKGDISLASQNSKGPKDFTGRYVFPYDAEDIKSHKWFKGVPWDRLHELEPPFVPKICAIDDTKYFDEEEEVSDWSESEKTEVSESAMPATSISPGLPAAPPVPLPPSGSADQEGPDLIISPTINLENATNHEQNSLGAPLANRPANHQLTRQHKDDEVITALQDLHHSVQKWALQAIITPYDSVRLRALDIDIDTLPGLELTDRTLLKQFVRVFGRKDRKRPRDRLLRDRETKAVVLDLRRKTAFLGYTWRRMRPAPMLSRPGLEGLFLQQQLGQMWGGSSVGLDGSSDNRWRCWYDAGASNPSWGGVAALRALHRGRFRVR
jgi:hypothetical protein